MHMWLEEWTCNLHSRFRLSVFVCLCVHACAGKRNRRVSGTLGSGDLNHVCVSVCLSACQLSKDLFRQYAVFTYLLCIRMH
jgi:hypothetical protein